MTTTRKDPRPLLKPLTDLADRVSRTPINPRQRRALGFDVTVDAPTSGDPPPANLAPRPVPQPSDAATVLDFVQRRETVARYVRDAIAAAVDQQKENANRRTGTSTSLTWILKILGDAYTLQLPTALRLHPTFYVGKLRRYRPATIPSDADAASVHAAAVRRATPPDGERDGGARDCPAPAAPSGEPSDRGAARSQRPPNDHASPFQRDGPAPLVDSAGNVRHIVEAMTTAPALRGRRRPVTISVAALYTTTAVFLSTGSTMSGG
ncbi:hypothetical protein PC128_g22743 [Phytophthora cactorum]|nr:hypothetical protein PC128_g22743 [Phytophthora cactorum]